MINCMSFNILGSDSAKTLRRGIPTAEVRYPHVVALIREKNADIVCIQEARSGETRNWQDRLLSDLTFCGYRAVSYFGETGISQRLSTGLMIFYKADRFERIDSGAVDYTSTEKQARAFIWANLTDKKHGRSLYVTNTHWSINWDSEGNTSPEAGDEHRTKQANELLRFWKDRVGESALFACGDYNCPRGSKWYDIAIGDVYKDAYTVSEAEPEENAVIDHCFVNPAAMSVKEYIWVKDMFDYEGEPRRYSDHRPILIRAEYKK